jgi:hypothetical protein
MLQCCLVILYLNFGEIYFSISKQFTGRDGITEEAGLEVTLRIGILEMLISNLAS